MYAYVEYVYLQVCVCVEMKEGAVCRLHRCFDLDSDISYTIL